MSEQLHIKLYKYDANNQILAIQRVFSDEEHDPKIFHYIVDGMLQELNHTIKESE